MDVCVNRFASGRFVALVIQLLRDLRQRISLVVEPLNPLGEFCGSAEKSLANCRIDCLCSGVKVVGVA